MKPTPGHLARILLLHALCGLALATAGNATGATPAELDALARSAQQMSWEQRFNEALALYERVLAEDPGHALAGLERAKVLSWAGRFEESAEAFRALLADTPGDVEARIGLARVLSWSGRNTEARAEHEAVLASHPGHPDALLGIAQTWAWSGNLAQARPAYEAAARAAEDPKDARIGLAWLDLWEGSPARARREAEALAARHPSDADTLELLAAVRAATAPWFSASWDQLDDSDRNLLTTTRLETGGTLARGPALRLAYADYDVRTAGALGSIRSLQGHATWVPRPRHAVEAMLGVDRLEGPGGEDHDVTDWGLRWSFPLRASWNGSLQARREPFRYSVPLIDNRIVIESLAATATGRVGEHWRLSATASAWSLSDDNRRSAAELAARRSWPRGTLTLEAGGNLRWLDWRRDLDNGYFDPSGFVAWGATARVFGPVPGTSTVDYDISTELGLQSFDAGGRRTSNDPYYLVAGQLGWQVNRGLRIEGWVEAGSYASQGAADWRYTRIGVRFRQGLGMGR